MNKLYKKSLLLLNALICMSVLSACSFAPTYERPEMDIPDAWQNVELGAAPLEQDWWKRFNDPVLNSLVAEALHNNQDLSESLAKIDSAAAQLGIARSAFLPHVNGAGSATKQSQSISGANSESTRPQYESGALNRAVHIYEGSLSASWEIDLWGKYRNAHTGLSDVLLSTAVGYEALRLSVAGQTAKSYFELLAFDMQLETAKRTLASREEALRIYTTRFDQGDITELDWLRAKSELETARASMLTTIVQLNSAEASLAVLLGRSPREIMTKNADRGITIEKLPAPPVIPAGLPSELLNRRPDIRAAEYMVMAYNANIGVARADFFPSISITGAIGTLSESTKNLFSGPTGLWSYGAAVNAPILDFGRRWYAVDDAQAQKRQSVALYRKTVQAAFQDLRTAFTAQDKANAIVDSVQAQVDNMRRASELARLQYDNGYADYLTVLDSERQLFSAELNLATVMRDRLNAVVAVCMALGGGWSETETNLEGTEAKQAKDAATEKE